MDDVNDGAVLLFFLLFDAQITESKTSSNTMKYFILNFRFSQVTCFLTFMKLCEKRRVNILGKFAPLDVDLRSHQLPHRVIVKLSERGGGCNAADEGVVERRESTKASLLAHYLPLAQVRLRVDLGVEKQVEALNHL